MAANGIRINTGTKRINVNDEGEYIELKFGDQAFPGRVFGLFDAFEAKRAEMLQQMDEINTREDETDTFGISRNQRDLLTLIESTHRYIANEIDNVFGPETCRKVFGDIVPSLEHVADFINALDPYFQSYSKEREKAVKTKYNAGRKGNA